MTKVYTDSFCDVLKKNEGMLVVVYTPKDAPVTPTNSSNFVPCPHCYGYYERKQLWKHSKYRCPLNTQNNDCEKDVLAKGSYLLPIPKYVRGQTRDVLRNMHRDESSWHLSMTYSS